MPLPDFTLNFGDSEVLITETNCWVCVFYEAPQYDHIYVYDPKTFVVFDCRPYIDRLIQSGYPMQIRRLPTPWDEDAYDKYLQNQSASLDDEWEELDGHPDSTEDH